MDENFTFVVQLEKKLSYKKVDFKENVRSLRIWNALHWLVNNSELYKKSGKVVDDFWFQEVTESAEDTVREFLEVSTDQTNGNVNTENKYISITDKDIAETDGYDSDRYSEIYANENVGKILWWMMQILKTSMIKC